MLTTDRLSIFDTPTVKMTITKQQLVELINFLIFNRNAKMTTNEVKTMLSGKPLTNTVISNLFNRALELQKDNLFSFIKLSKANTSFPEVITYTHITPDMKQLNTETNLNLYQAISSIPEYANKICLNVTPMLKGSGEPSDIFNFQSIVIRDLLSRSYFDTKSPMWLSPSIIRYICRFYNMSMSTSIASVFNLTYLEQQAIATIFSLFFLQKVSNKDVAETYIKNNKLGIGSSVDITNIINLIKGSISDVAYANMTLDDVCTCINKLGIGRLESINRKFLYTRLKGIGPDLFTSTMALDYPPYWTYLVLLTISGRKMGLMNTFKQNDIQKDAHSFSDDIVKTYSFLSAL